MTELRALMEEQIALAGRIQAVIDHLVPPTTTGYLHHEESWTVAWIRAGEYSVEYEIALDPPEHAFEWNYATSVRIEIIKGALGADGAYASAREKGRMRYIATFNRKKVSRG